jgi:hypothetical protein
MAVPKMIGARGHRGLESPYFGSWGMAPHGFSLKIPYFSAMKDQQKVLSLYFDQAAYADGAVDITAKFYEHVPSEQVESIKYVTTDATEGGIYFTVVYLEKKEKQKGVMGFTSS